MDSTSKMEISSSHGIVNSFETTKDQSDDDDDDIRFVGMYNKDDGKEIVPKISSSLAAKIKAEVNLHRKRQFKKLNLKSKCEASAVDNVHLKSEVKQVSSKVGTVTNFFKDKKGIVGKGQDVLGSNLEEQVQCGVNPSQPMKRIPGENLSSSIAQLTTFTGNPPVSGNNSKSVQNVQSYGENSKVEISDYSPVESRGIVPHISSKLHSLTNNVKKTDDLLNASLSKNNNIATSGVQPISNKTPEKSSSKMKTNIPEKSLVTLSQSCNNVVIDGNKLNVSSSKEVPLFEVRDRRNFKTIEQTKVVSTNIVHRKSTGTLSEGDNTKAIDSDFVSQTSKPIIIPIDPPGKTLASAVKNLNFAPKNGVKVTNGDKDMKSNGRISSKLMTVLESHSLSTEGSNGSNVGVEGCESNLQPLPKSKIPEVSSIHEEQSAFILEPVRASSCTSNLSVPIAQTKRPASVFEKSEILESPKKQIKPDIVFKFAMPVGFDHKSDVSLVPHSIQKSPDPNMSLSDLQKDLKPQLRTDLRTSEVTGNKIGVNFSQKTYSGINRASPVKCIASEVDESPLEKTELSTKQVESMNINRPSMVFSADKSIPHTQQKLGEIDKDVTSDRGTVKESCISGRSSMEGSEGSPAVLITPSKSNKQTSLSNNVNSPGSKLLILPGNTTELLPKAKEITAYESASSGKDMVTKNDDTVEVANGDEYVKSTGRLNSKLIAGLKICGISNKIAENSSVGMYSCEKKLQSLAISKIRETSTVHEEQSTLTREHVKVTSCKSNPSVSMTQTKRPASVFENPEASKSPQKRIKPDIVSNFALSIGFGHNSEISIAPHSIKKSPDLNTSLSGLQKDLKPQLRTDLRTSEATGYKIGVDIAQNTYCGIDRASPVKCIATVDEGFQKKTELSSKQVESMSIKRPSVVLNCHSTLQKEMSSIDKTTHTRQKLGEVGKNVTSGGGTVKESHITGCGGASSMEGSEGRPIALVMFTKLNKQTSLSNNVNPPGSETLIVPNNTTELLHIAKEVTALSEKDIPCKANMHQKRDIVASLRTPEKRNLSMLNTEPDSDRLLSTKSPKEKGNLSINSTEIITPQSGLDDLISENVLFSSKNRTTNIGDVNSVSSMAAVKKCINEGHSKLSSNTSIFSEKSLEISINPITLPVKKTSNLLQKSQEVNKRTPKQTIPCYHSVTKGQKTPISEKTPELIAPHASSASKIQLSDSKRLFISPSKTGAFAGETNVNNLHQEVLVPGTSSKSIVPSASGIISCHTKNTIDAAKGDKNSHQQLNPPEDLQSLENDKGNADEEHTKSFTVLHFRNAIVQVMKKQESLQNSEEQPFDECVLQLLNSHERELIHYYFIMSSQAKELYCRMYNRKFSWHRLSNIKYEMNVEEVFNELEKIGFIISDTKTENLSTLLDLLTVNEMRSLSKNFRLSQAGKTKQLLKEVILTCAKKQTTLPFGFNNGADAVLRKQIENVLGRCIRLKTEPRDLFRRLILMFFMSAHDEDGVPPVHRMLQVERGELSYPDYKIIKVHRVFTSRDELVRYQEAYDMETELSNFISKKEVVNMERVLQTIRAYFVLVVMDEKQSSFVAQLPVFLRYFTAGSCCAYALHHSIEPVKKCFRDGVELAIQILQELLDQNLYLPHYRGHWYEQLAQLYQKKQNMLEAVFIIQEGMTDNDVDELHHYKLSKRGHRLLKGGNKKLLKEYRRRLRKTLGEESEDCPPVIQIRAKSVFSNIIGRKQVYLLEDEVRQEKTYLSVEELAITHYQSLGFAKGVHDEGGIINTVFGLIFWDIIYECEVPDVFQNPYQFAPLDLRTGEFYHNRKEAIEKRLREMISWPREKINALIQQRYTENDGKVSIINWKWFKNFQEVVELVHCMGMPLVTRLCERLAKSFRVARSGFPDLVLWTPGEPKCKFVEVKGPGDRLSPNQSFWMKFLISIGANAEVCYVITSGSSS